MTDRASDSAKSPGLKRIGRYRILERIGRGSMGHVYAAQDERFDRVVAVKVLVGDLESNPETKARFQREARATAALDHRNIVKIFDADQEDGRSYIVMERLDGMSLEAFLQTPAAATLDVRVDLMIQLCDGLAAAHARGIVHRDLKPSNLFVEHSGLLKILDFGIAHLTDENMTLAGARLGTPDYMAPEQAEGARVDARADIYSAGAVFYFVLTGRKPFPGRDVPTVLEQLRTEDPQPFGDDVPPEFAALVLRTMSKRVEDRPERVEDLSTALSRAHRQHQQEGRRLVDSARERIAEVTALIEAGAAALQGLGVGADMSRETTALAALTAALDATPAKNPALLFRASRNRLAELNDQLDRLAEQISLDTDRRRELAAIVTDGEQCLADGDAVAAVKNAEAVLSEVPGASRARALADKAGPAASAQHAREQRVDELVEAGRRALSAGDLETAIHRSQDALDVIPDHPHATSLLADAEDSVARERRRVERVVAQLLDDAVKALHRGDLGTADTLVGEAEDVGDDFPTVQALRSSVEQAKAAAAAAEDLKLASTEEISRARGLFRRGLYDEAIQQLRAFLVERPVASLVEAERVRLVGLRAQLTALTTEARTRASELLARAKGANGEPSTALPLVRDALRADPTNRDAAQLLDQLMARQLEFRIAEQESLALAERRAEARRLVAVSRRAAQQGYTRLALDAAQGALCVLPGDPEAEALADMARRDLESDEDGTFDLAMLPIGPASNAAWSLPDVSRAFGRAVGRLRASLATGKPNVTPKA